MRFYTAALLVSSISAYVFEDYKLSDGTCVENEYRCEVEGSVCVKRTVTLTKTSDTDYKKVVAEDPDFVDGNINYKCFPKADADTLVAGSGAKESKTQSSATYEIMEAVPLPAPEPEPENPVGGDNHGTMLAGGFAAALAAVTMF